MHWFLALEPVCEGLCRLNEVSIPPPTKHRPRLLRKYVKALSPSLKGWRTFLLQSPKDTGVGEVAAALCCSITSKDTWTQTAFLRMLVNAIQMAPGWQWHDRDPGHTHSRSLQCRRKWFYCCEHNTAKLGRSFKTKNRGPGSSFAFFPMAFLRNMQSSKARKNPICFCPQSWSCILAL